MLADEVSNPMFTGLFPSGTSTSHANSLYGAVNDPDSFLVPLVDALPFGDAATGSVTLSDPETMAVVANFRYYDETAVDQNSWWNDPGVATGSLQLETATKNAIIAIYVNRNTVVEVLDYEDDGTTYIATDVQLWFGWNLLEMVEVDAETTELVIRSDSSLPSWELNPFVN